MKKLLWKGKEVCDATHPKQPNFRGTSRGRKLHLVKEGDKTICNMLVTYVYESGSATLNSWRARFCLTCFD